jgi:NTP pyrophosphatase (non-canonical NTP hydrolase)
MSSSSTDDTTTISDLRQRVQAFVDERDWRKYHTPKNLSMSLAIEAAELMEHFQWLTNEEAEAEARDPAQRPDITDELADCLAFILSLADAMDIDLATAVRNKLVKNAAKYPADQYRGRFRL